MGETDHIAIIWEKKHIDKQVQVPSKAMHICAADAIIFCLIFILIPLCDKSNWYLSNSG